jgi:hypothetical protein
MCRSGGNTPPFYPQDRFSSVGIPCELWAGEPPLKQVYTIRDEVIASGNIGFISVAFETIARTVTEKHQ